MNQKDKIKKAASLLGKKGGQVKSDKKTLSSRENGKKGGRPRKDAGNPGNVSRETFLADKGSNPFY